MREQEEAEAREIVRAAWCNSTLNGNDPDPSDLQEAIQLSDYCEEVERWVWRDGEGGFDRRFNILLRAVKDLRLTHE